MSGTASPDEVRAFFTMLEQRGHLLLLLVPEVRDIVERLGKDLEQILEDSDRAAPEVEVP